MGERKSNKKENAKLWKEKENQREIGLKFRQKKEVKNNKFNMNKEC